MTLVPVNRMVLAWARAERGLTQEAAAERLGVPLEELQELESGARQPTVGELRNMAAKYEIGFSSLLMPDTLPDSTRLKVEDFRTHKSGRSNWHPDLLSAMDEINVTIDALADLKAVAPDLFKETLPRLGALTNAPKVAENERKRLGLTPEIQASWKSGADAFRRLRSLIEAQGAFVYVVTASTTDDWRGLAVLDERGIPFIVVNGNEYEATARCFSLMHEYAHLLRRQSAISNHRGKGIVEAFCNSFAAHFLMPEKEFKKAVHSVAGGYRSTWPDTLIKKISKPFRTSMSAVVLHLQNLGFGPDNLFAMKVEEWNSREKKERKPPFVDYYEKTTNRLGTRHIALVFDALDRGRINQLDAYEMLDVQPANFAKLRSEVKERQAAYGWRG